MRSTNLSRVASRFGAVGAVAGVIALGLFTTSCGGGGSFSLPDMRLQEFLFVDRGLNPTAPTGTTNLPRNAQILMVFTAPVNPASVTQQTIQVRYGATQQSIPAGSFSVDGNTVRFDPTVTAQGEPNPTGFPPVTQCSVDIPDIDEQPFTVQNLDADPNLTTFFTTFVTSAGFLRELTPPEVVGVFFQPAQDPLTQQVPGNSIMAVQFSEPMDPLTFKLGGPIAPENLGKNGVAVPNSAYPCIDIRYKSDSQINRDNGLASLLPPPYPLGTWNGAPVSGYFTWNAGLDTFFFHPTFSWGDKKYVFTAQVFQCLKDLAGNLLVNPRSFGPYTCDGFGRKTGKILYEQFTDSIDQDPTVTDADWNGTEEGFLKGQSVTTRRAEIYGYWWVGGEGGQGDQNKMGQYAAIADPLIGAKLNQYVANVTPPTNQGRRVQWAFSDTEIGPDGTVTACWWGPDSNATFAANYPNVKLRMGFQKQNTISLGPSFDGNYEGSPTVLYDGTYQVAQAQNVGNTPGHPLFPEPNYTVGFGCNPGQLTPLFANTGWTAWPNLTNTFDWNEGDSAVDNDRVLVFDASVAEGDTWEQVRGWFAVTYPCSGVLIGGFPTRRMYATYEEDSPNPPSNFVAGIVNPEPSITDTAFTITKKVSLAQTKFYTDGAQPVNSVQTTFGDLSNYLPIQLTPSVQAGGSTVKVEFQACNACLADRRTINQAAPFVADFTDDLSLCDGYRNIRWRIWLISNLLNGQVARLDSVLLPVQDDFN